MSAAQDAIKTFTQQYYLALMNAVGGSPDTFQLAQGSINLGTTSDLIWQFLDSIPPASVNQIFNFGTFNSFANTYGAVVNNLYPQNGDAEQTALGDKYTAWLTFQKDSSNWPQTFNWSDPNAAMNLRLALFNKFAVMQGLDQGQTNAMRTTLTQVDLTSEAMLMFNAAKPSFAYTATIAKLRTAINGGQARKIQFNSKTASSDVSAAWAKGSVSGSYEFFSAEVSADWSSFTEDLANSGFDLTINYDKVATLSGGPYAKLSTTDSDLTSYKPWYNSEALNQAYKHNDNNVWQHGSPTWDEIFGPNGSLKRTAVALVVADGITSTITSSASVSSSQRSAFQMAAKAGFWPFFKAEGQGGWTHDVGFHDDGTFSITSKSLAGNPNVIAVVVEDLTSQFH